MTRKNNSPNSRRINPKLGFLGALGFLGFAGIWTYQVDKTIFPFIFFVFFGFFGFFFEGKISNTLMDERYIENKRRAEWKSYRIGMGLSFFSLIVSSWAWLFPNNEIKMIFLTISLSVIFALAVFLSEYLLYRYDYDDSNEE